MPATSSFKASTSASPEASFCPMMAIDPVRRLPRSERLHPDHVMALGRGDHRRNQVPRQLLVGHDHRARTRIAENMGMIAFGVGGVGRNRHAARGHDREVGDQPFGPVLADQRDAVAGLEPDAASSEAASDATCRAASLQLIERHSPRAWPTGRARRLSRRRASGTARRDCRTVRAAEPPSPRSSLIARPLRPRCADRRRRPSGH